MPRIPSRLRRAATITAAATVAVALASCTTTPGGGGDADRGDLLTVQFQGSPISLNPALAGTGGSTVFTYLAYDPLIYLSGDGELVPDLATEWEFLDADNTQLEVTLRDGVNFHDGSEVDAEAVAASMNYFLEAGGPSVGEAGPVASVEASGDDTVLITYESPFPDGPLRLTQGYMFGNIIGPDGLADPDSLLTAMDGAGQYRYNADESVAESSYVYDRNEEYWNTDAQQYERIVVQVIGDPNAVISAATTGQVDFASGNPATAEQAEAGGLQVITAPFFNWGLVIVDRDGTLTPALAEQNVRQAMALAIDREAIAEARGAEFTHPNGQVSNAGVPGNIDGYGYDFDLEAAKDLMAQSAFPDGFSLTILSEGVLDGQSLIAQTMIANFGELGIDVQLQVEPDVPTFIGTAGTAQYSALLWPIVGTKASEYVGRFNGPGFLNSFNVSDSELADLQAQSAIGTEDEQRAVQEAITERSNDLAWFIPLVATDSVFYVAADVENVTASVLNPNPMPLGPSAEYAWRPVR